MEFEEFVYTLLICFSLSFLIGIERQYRKRIICLRTTILVSLGAFLFVTFSFSVGASDISRIASQVVAGIGFLGAGVILKDGKKIRGLTTAATLWCDAAIGVLCAGGAIKEAILGTALLLFANTILRYVNKLINEISNTKHLIYLYELKLKVSKNITSLKKELKEFMDLNHVEVKSLTIKKNNNINNINYNIEITKENVQKLEKLLDTIYDKYKVEGLEIKEIEEIKKDDLDDDL